MKLRNFTLMVSTFLGLFFACNNDDDGPNVVVEPPRDRAEVYAEDLAEIETYLSTHFFNYEEFNFSDPYGVDNDNFQLTFGKIEGANSDKTPIIEMTEYLKYKMVEYDDIEYKLYYLQIREGLGNNLHPSDEAFMTYEGFITEDNYVFDSTVNPVPVNLTAVGLTIRGVVFGFRDGLIEFNAGYDHVDNGDGTLTYRNHGIGAIFVPSGIGYFATGTSGVSPYTPMIFKVNLMGVIHTDFDQDNVWSYIEDLDGDGDTFNDDTDGDGIPNFIDADDDADNVLTKHEDLEPDSDLMVDTNGDGDPTNDIGDGDPTNDDTDEDGIPNYLDEDTAQSNQPEE